MKQAEFADALANAGVSDIKNVTDPAWRHGKIGAAMEGAMLIVGQRLRFGFWLGVDFPDSCPKVFVLSEEAKRLPHVDRDWKVCAFESENSLLDYRNEAGLVRETVERARSVIEDGLIGRNRRDFLNELEAYWPSETNIPSAVTAGDSPHPLKASSMGSQLLALADTAELMTAAFPNLRKQLRNGHYLVIDGSRLQPVHPRELASWPAVIPLLTPESAQVLGQLRVKRDQTIPIVLGFPRPSGGRALVGMVLRKFGVEGALLDSTPSSVNLFGLSRFDRDQLQERLPDVAHPARIAIIGCGAVGGHVAHALAWSGARELVLIDPDQCRGANTYRHVLGRKGWGRSKVFGLKVELEGSVPGLQVTPIESAVNQVLFTRPDVLRSVDAVVVAIGNHSVPLRLNDVFAAQRLSVPVVYTWLEPYGIGGHAALVRYGRPGCLRCLFEHTPELTCAAEFAAPGQRFARRELGCHALFTPYGDLDARSTSLLAARLAANTTAVPSLHSWRGAATEFLAAGFRLSPRYEAYAQPEQPLHVRQDCVTCSI